MTQPNEYHGWSVGDKAVFISPLSDDDDRLGLWVQDGMQVEVMALFADPDAALTTQALLDTMLMSTAEANRRLVARQ